jgi:hypothetical protein
MNTAFFIVSGLFVVAMVGLAITAVRWAVGRDRLARRQRADLSETDTRP